MQLHKLCVLCSCMLTLFAVGRFSSEEFRAGRLLTSEEKACAVGAGAVDNRCCGLLPRCSIGVSNPCGDYDIYTCNVNRVYFNPSGANRADCIRTSPGMGCNNGSVDKPCVQFYDCEIDESGECSPLPYVTTSAYAPEHCWDDCGV